MSEFQEFLNEQLQDDEFRKEWEDIQPEKEVSSMAFMAVQESGMASGKNSAMAENRK